jgi:hypothetical protein
VTRTKRRFLGAVTAAGVLLALNVGPAQAASVYTGAGAAAMTFTAPSGDIGALGCAPQSLVISGTGTAAVTLFGVSYAGPITFSGTLLDCQYGSQFSGSVNLVVDGSAAFGELHCGTPAAPLQGQLITVGSPSMVVGGHCDVGGQTGPLSDLFFEGGVVSPTGVTTTPGISSFTLVSPILWAPITS